MLLTISFLKNNYTSNFDSLFSPKEDKEVEFLSQNKYYEEVTGQRDRALVEGDCFTSGIRLMLLGTLLLKRENNKGRDSI